MDPREPAPPFSNFSLPPLFDLADLGVPESPSQQYEPLALSEGTSAPPPPFVLPLNFGSPSNSQFEFSLNSPLTPARASWVNTPPSPIALPLAPSFFAPLPHLVPRDNLPLTSPMFSPVSSSPSPSRAILPRGSPSPLSSPSPATTPLSSPTSQSQVKRQHTATRQRNWRERKTQQSSEKEKQSFLEGKEFVLQYLGINLEEIKHVKELLKLLRINDGEIQEENTEETKNKRFKAEPGKLLSAHFLKVAKENLLPSERLKQTRKSYGDLSAEGKRERRHTFENMVQDK